MNITAAVSRLLEPCAGQLACTVLKGGCAGDGVSLPDKLSFASQSLRGDQFRPMILSVIETAKRLNLNTSHLLRELCTAGLQGQPITTRLPLPDPRACQLTHS